MDFVYKVNVLLEAKNIVEARALIISQLDGDRFLPSMLVANCLTSFNKTVFSHENNEFQRNLDKYDWNFDLWLTIRIQLRDNFSEEKLEYCIEVMEYLREKGDPRFQPVEDQKKPKIRQEIIKNPSPFANFFRKKR